MNNLTLKSALFFLLFAMAFTSCKEDEEEVVPVITVSGANPLILDTINTVYVEPGVSTDKGTLITDLTSVYPNKRGEYTVYYSASDGPTFGYATRTVIVKNPSDVLEGIYSVEVINTSSGVTEEYYADQITIDDYINGKFYFKNFNAPCEDQNLIGKYNWFNNTIDLDEQTYLGQQVLNNTGSPYTVNFSGSDITFEMIVSTAGSDRKYIYRKRNFEAAISRIMAINLVGDVLPLDAYSNNFNFSSGLGHSLNSLYVPVEAGNNYVEFTSAGTCVSIVDNLTSFNENASYSLFLAGSLANSSLSVEKFEDDLSTPPAGQSRVRFFNGAEGQSNVSVDVVDAQGAVNTIFSGVNFKNGPVNNVNAGNYVVNISSNGTVIYSIAAASFVAEKVYTIYIYEFTGNTYAKIITNK